MRREREEGGLLSIACISLAVLLLLGSMLRYVQASCPCIYEVIISD
jgi:hypothetical protein